MHLRRRFVRSTCWKSSLPWLFNRPAPKHLSLSTFNTKQDSVIEKENCFQAQKCPIWPDAGSLPGSRIFFARIALLDSLDRMFLTRPINFSGVIQFVTALRSPSAFVRSPSKFLNCIRRKNTSVYGSVAPRLRHVRQVHLFKLQLGSQLSQLSQCLLWWPLWVWIHILWLWCVFCSRSLWRVRKIHQAYKTSFWVASAGFFGVHLCKSIPSVRQILFLLKWVQGKLNDTSIDPKQCK